MSTANKKTVVTPGNSMHPHILLCDTEINIYNVQISYHSEHWTWSQVHSWLNLMMQLDSRYRTSSNKCPNSTPFCDIGDWNMSNLELDHSKLFKLRSNDAIGFRICDFILMFLVAYSPTQEDKKALKIWVIFQGNSSSNLMVWLDLPFVWFLLVSIGNYVYLTVKLTVIAGWTSFS